MPRRRKPLTLDDAALRDLYAREIEPRLIDLERQRVSAVWKSWAWVGLGVPGTLGIGALVGSLAPYWGIALAIVGLLLVFAAAYGSLDYLKQEARLQILKAIADALDLKYLEYIPLRDPRRDAGPPGLMRCSELGLLPRADGASAMDLFEGRRGASDFTIFNAELVTHKGPVYWGLAVWIEAPVRFNGVTLVARDAGIFNALRARPEAMQQVSLGEPRFEQAFEVFGTDQVEARALLHPAFLETLLEMDRRFKGEKLRCAFVDGDLLICIEGRWRFTVGSPWSTFLRYEPVARYAGDLILAMSLVDTVLAGPPSAYQAEIRAARAQLGRAAPKGASRKRRSS